MSTWADFEAAAPGLAAEGRRLLYQGAPVAYGFLATVRSRDGGPRVHPVCPIIVDGTLWVFLVEMSPKHADLRADGRYALHAFPVPGGGEEFYITGVGHEVDDSEVRAKVVASTGGQQGVHAFERLFALDVAHVLHTRWENWGTVETWPAYERWP